MTATEGGSQVRAYNINNQKHSAGDEIRINFKNANGNINASYTISGYANYH